MNNKELNLFDLLKAIKKYKILMLSVFIITAIISISMVLQIDKSYKSVLIINMPLQDGIETEYTIDVLTKYKGKQLEKLFNLENESIKLNEFSLSQIRHESNSTFGVLDFITNQPDTNNIVKNSFISYINNLDFFRKLKKIETDKYNDIVNTISKDFSDKNNAILNFDSKNNPLILNPIELKEKLYEAKVNLSYTDSIIEVSYLAMPEKFKPSYAMLIIMALLFSFFAAFTAVVLVLFIKEISNN